MPAPRFSVVIPTYNQASFLEGALDSVLKQTLEDFEVIIVNNYSSDGTADVLKRASESDDRVHAIDFKNDGIIGASRNAGIRAAQGRYVAFLDSDDVWYTTKLERVDEALRAHPEVRFVCHDEEKIRGERTVGHLRYGPGKWAGDRLHEFLLYVRNCLSTSATVVEMEALRAAGGFSENPDFVTVEDYDLWLRLSIAAPAHFIHEPLGHFRVHPQSTTMTTERHWQNLAKLLDHHFSVAAGGIDRGRMRRRYASVRLARARSEARSGQLGRALGSMASAWSISPWLWKLYPGLPVILADWARSSEARNG